MWLSSVSMLCALLNRLLADITFPDEQQEKYIRSMNWWELSHPTEVYSNGDFKSHNIHYIIPHARVRRELGQEDIERHYKLNLNGKVVQVDLKPNEQLFAPDLIIERWSNNNSISHFERTRSSACHFMGKVQGMNGTLVALATCHGLTGVIMTPEGHFFVEPLKGSGSSLFQPQPHVVYKATGLGDSMWPLHTDVFHQHSLCGHNSDGVTLEEEKAPADILSQRRVERSVSEEYFVETLVVVDQAMMEFYKNEDISTYVFTIMNMVAALYHDASLGNLVHIVVVKVLLLEQDEGESGHLKITHHADNTLSNFCEWQETINGNMSDPTRHDVAILLTRLDICSRMNEPCSTLGLSQVSGMCQPHRSCNVNEDTGLALAYTIAHELGHNFGMKHDGSGECVAPSDKRGYLMFPEFLVDAGSPMTWSNCSRQAITRFLDRGWGSCLLDEPTQFYHYPYPNKPPGLLYDVNHQCRLQYGSEAEHCDGIQNFCTTLWCRVKNHCVSKLEPSAEGTICEWENTTAGDVAAMKWCIAGKCIPIGERPEAIDGGWAEWSSWSECSRTCGGGISVVERHCLNPMPAHGGKFCSGERKRYKICQTEACPAGAPSFREVQCSGYNSKPYRSTFYEWEPINHTCQLHCKPKNHSFFAILNDMVNDGTPCLPGTKHMCIAGHCRKVGCDWKLDSNATEDRCGVCQGDGSSCKTVKDQFKGQQGLGYVEAAVIPEGARNIRIEEVAEANNYLAIRSESGQYYLNGHWYIQWSGDINFAGTTITYERLGNKEGIFAPGPLLEPIHVMLLFQSHNPGIVFEYTVPNENASSNSNRQLVFSWHHTEWSACTVSCGSGYQWSRTICTELEGGVVDDTYCANFSKPDDKRTKCNEYICPARWWAGPWQDCSVSCGDEGVRHRTVLCIRSLGPEEQMALEDAECEELPKLAAVDKCVQLESCPSIWKLGPWSECLESCGNQQRDVACTAASAEHCDLELKPEEERPCSYDVICGHWEPGEWSECSKSCGGGVQHRDVKCIDGDACLLQDMPHDIIPCNEFDCSSSLSNRGRENRIQKNLGTRRMHNRFQMKAENTEFEEDHALAFTIRRAGDFPFNEELGTTTVASYQQPTAPPETRGFWNKLWSFMGREVVSSVEDTFARGTPPSHFNEKWHTSPWGECSVTCGTGQRRRHIWCTKEGHCDLTIMPDSVTECTAQACITWVSGSWSQCSSTCGTGKQERNVQCINLATDKAEDTCNESLRPNHEQECHMDRCQTVSAALNKWSNEKCLHDMLATETCSQLRMRGFCTFRYVQKSCCFTCAVEQAAESDALT